MTTKKLQKKSKDTWKKPKNHNDISFIPGVVDSQPTGWGPKPSKKQYGGMMGPRELKEAWQRYSSYLNTPIEKRLYSPLNTKPAKLRKRINDPEVSKGQDGLKLKPTVDQQTYNDAKSYWLNHISNSSKREYKQNLDKFDLKSINNAQQVYQSNAQFYEPGKRFNIEPLRIAGKQIVATGKDLTNQIFKTNF